MKFIFILGILSCKPSTIGLSGSLTGVLERENAGFIIDRVSSIALEGDSFLYEFRLASNPLGELMIYFCYPAEQFSLLVNGILLERRRELSLEDVSCSTDSLNIENLNDFFVFGPLIINSDNWDIPYSIQGFVVEDDLGNILDVYSYVLHGLNSTSSKPYRDVLLSDYNITILIQDNDQEDFLIRDVENVQILENGTKRASHNIGVTEVSQRRELDFYFCLDTDLLNLYVNGNQLRTELLKSVLDSSCTQSLLGPVVLLRNLLVRQLNIELEPVNNEEANVIRLISVRYYAFLRGTFEKFGIEKKIDFIILDDDQPDLRLTYLDNTFVSPLTFLEGNRYQFNVSLDTIPNFQSGEDFLELNVVVDSPLYMNIIPNSLRFDRDQNSWNIPQTLEVIVLENFLAVSSSLDTGFSIVANGSALLFDEFYTTIDHYYNITLLDNDIPAWEVSPQSVKVDASVANFTFLLNSTTSVSTGITSMEDIELYFCYSSELELTYQGSSSILSVSESSFLDNFFCPLINDGHYGYLRLSVQDDRALNVLIDVKASNFNTRESCNEFQYIYLFALTENLQYASLPLPSIQVRKEVSPFDGRDGDGTSENPYQISDSIELQRISCNLGAHYQLQNNIDLTNTSSWSDSEGGSGFVPIAGDKRSDIDLFQGNTFSGILDGNGYSIDNLYISRSDSYVGLFGALGYSSEIRSLSFRNARVFGCGYVALISGISWAEKIYNISISNSMVNETTLCSNKQIYFGSVIGDKRRGDLYSTTVQNVNINAPNSSYVASLVGRNYSGFIYEVVSSASVVGFNYVSGLVGVNLDFLHDSTFLGNVSSRVNSNFVGGAVAANLVSAKIERTNISATISGSVNIGGFVGYNQGDLFYNYAVAEITTLGSLVSKVGGFTGSDEGGLHKQNITQTNISIPLELMSSLEYIGGYFGKSDRAMIDESIFLGNIVFSSNTNLLSLNVLSLGGFGGQMDSTQIFNSYSAGTISIDVTSNIIQEYDSFGLFLGAGSSSVIKNSYASMALNIDFLYHEDYIAFQGTNNLVSIVNSYWPYNLIGQNRGTDIILQRKFRLLKECGGSLLVVACSDTYEQHGILRWNQSIWDLTNTSLLGTLRNVYPLKQRDYLEKLMVRQKELTNIRIQCGMPLEDCTSIIGETELLFSHANASSTVSGGVVSWKLFQNKNNVNIDFINSRYEVSESSLSKIESWMIEATLTYEDMQLKKIFTLEVTPGFLLKFARSSLLVDNAPLPLNYRQNSGDNSVVPLLSWRYLPDDSMSLILLVESLSQNKIYMAQFTNRTASGFPSTTSGLSWIRSRNWVAPSVNPLDEENLKFHMYVLNSSLNVTTNILQSSTQIEATYAANIIRHEVLTSVLTHEVLLESSKLKSLYSSERAPSPLSIQVSHTFLIDQESDYVGDIPGKCNGDNKFPGFDIRNISSYAKSLVFIIEDLNILQRSLNHWVLLDAYLNLDTLLVSQSLSISSILDGVSEFNSIWTFGLNSWSSISGETRTRGWVAPCSRISSIVKATVYALNIFLEDNVSLDNITTSEFERTYRVNILPSRENIILILARGSEFP